MRNFTKLIYLVVLALIIFGLFYFSPYLRGLLPSSKPSVPSVTVTNSMPNPTSGSTQPSNSAFTGTSTTSPATQVTPPVVTAVPLLTTNFCDQRPSSASTTASACVKLGPWHGKMYTANVPIYGYVVGSIKKLTVDGKSIPWNSKGEINTTVQLKLEFGMNTYKVYVEDSSGKTATQDVNINIERDD